MILKDIDSSVLSIKPFYMTTYDKDGNYYLAVKYRVRSNVFNQEFMYQFPKDRDSDKKTLSSLKFYLTF